MSWVPLGTYAFICGPSGRLVVLNTCIALMNHHKSRRVSDGVGEGLGGQTRVGKDHPEVLVTVGGTVVTSRL